MCDLKFCFPVVFQSKSFVLVKSCKGKNEPGFQFPTRTKKLNETGTRIRIQFSVLLPLLSFFVTENGSVTKPNKRNENSFVKILTIFPFQTSIHQTCYTKFVDSFSVLNQLTTVIMAKKNIPPLNVVSKITQIKV